MFLLAGRSKNVRVATGSTIAQQIGPIQHNFGWKTARALAAVLKSAVQRPKSSDQRRLIGGLTAINVAVAGSVALAPAQHTHAVEGDEDRCAHVGQDSHPHGAKAQEDEE